MNFYLVVVFSHHHGRKQHPHRRWFSFLLHFFSCLTIVPILSMWVFPKIVGKTPQNGWLVYNGNPYEQMDDLGVQVPLFSETSIESLMNWHWFVLFSPRKLGKMIPNLTVRIFFKGVGSTTNEMTMILAIRTWQLLREIPWPFWGDGELKRDPNLNGSAQIIANSHDLTVNGGLVQETFYFKAVRRLVKYYNVARWLENRDLLHEKGEEVFSHECFITWKKERQKWDEGWGLGTASFFLSRCFPFFFSALSDLLRYVWNARRWNWKALWRGSWRRISHHLNGVFSCWVSWLWWDGWEGDGFDINWHKGK